MSEMPLMTLTSKYYFAHGFGYGAQIQLIHRHRIAPAVAETANRVSRFR